MSCEQQNETSSTPKVIWVVNPFDQLPNETDVPLRYWKLCSVLADQGHEVIWWSSDFSHLTKTKRQPCPPCDGFTVRLIKTPPYTKNISFARLRNHQAFATGFYKDAIAGLADGSLKAPDRMVISLPPLGIAEQAFKIRDAVNRNTLNQKGEVIVDIQDAWPEVFYQLLPRPLRRSLGPLLLRSLHSSARSTYRGADKISAVGQSYLDLATTYLTTKSKEHQKKPTHLCYLGADLTRFQGRSEPQTHKESGLEKKEPLKAVYMGSMGLGYDLKTFIEVAAKWQQEDCYPWQIHFAGSGTQMNSLQAKSQKFDLLGERVVFHGQLGRDAINKLLLDSDLALVPNRPDSLVACPNKACEYAAAGLPILSCLGGELEQLLRAYNAGSEYKEGDMESLHAALESYLLDPNRLIEQASNARKMAATLFDRKHSYQKLANFIIQDRSPYVLL